MADYFPIESPSDECSQGLAERAWQGHVDAGRIGSRSAPDQARLEKLAADDPNSPDTNAAADVLTVPSEALADLPEAEPF